MRPSLLQTLKQLRLSGLAESLEVRLSEASGNRLDHAEFLELILQDELNVRLSRLVMGMKQLPRRSGECLLEIIMRRHENRSTMMTSNRPLEDWAKLIGDVPAATAILDRFLQHATLINITGRSYRLRHGNSEEAKARGRRASANSVEPSTAGGEANSPPEDAVTKLPVSSVAGASADHTS
jgi:hypothetical protein